MAKPREAGRRHAITRRRPGCVDMSPGEKPRTCFRKTCRRENVPGHAHALTFSCFRRRPFLGRDRSRAWLADSIDAARESHRFDVWAYVIMPEHVHLVIWPRFEEYSISDILRDIKRPVAREAIGFVREHVPEYLERMRDARPNGKVAHRFWQRRGGYDRNLLQPALIRSQIDYVHANPVRRGLADLPDGWYWSSSRHYSGSGPVPLAVDSGSLPLM